MTITHPDLVRALVKPPMDIIATLAPETVDLWHAATGIAGETGELLEALVGDPKTMDILGQAPCESGIVDLDNIVEELGDIEFYMEQLRQRVGMDRNPDVDSDAMLIPLSIGRLLFNAAHIAAAGTAVLDAVKKAAVYNKALDLEALADAMVRLDLFMGSIRFQFALSREQVLTANIAKLSKRYAALTYSDAAAHERADKSYDAQLARNFIGMREPLTGDMQDMVAATKGDHNVG